MSTARKQVKESTLRSIAQKAGMGVTARKRAGSKEEYIYLFQRVPGGGNKIMWEYLSPKQNLGDVTREQLDARMERLKEKVTAVKEGREPPRKELAIVDADAVLAAIGDGATLKEIAERLEVSARSPRLKRVIQELEEEGKIKTGRYYMPTQSSDE